VSGCVVSISASSRESGRTFSIFVITGLVPVMTMEKIAALHIIGMAGTGPAMTREAANP
jgi:hypothetical protein